MQPVDDRSQHPIREARAARTLAVVPRGPPFRFVLTQQLGVLVELSVDVVQPGLQIHRGVGLELHDRALDVRVGLHHRFEAALVLCNRLRLLPRGLCTFAHRLLSRQALIAFSRPFTSRTRVAHRFRVVTVRAELARSVAYHALPGFVGEHVTLDAAHHRQVVGRRAAALVGLARVGRDAEPRERRLGLLRGQRHAVGGQILLPGRLRLALRLGGGEAHALEHLALLRRVGDGPILRAQLLGLGLPRAIVRVEDPTDFRPVFGVCCATHQRAVQVLVDCLQNARRARLLQHRRLIPQALEQGQVFVLQPPRAGLELAHQPFERSGALGHGRRQFLVDHHLEQRAHHPPGIDHVAVLVHRHARERPLGLRPVDRCRRHVGHGGDGLGGLHRCWRGRGRLVRAGRFLCVQRRGRRRRGRLRRAWDLERRRWRHIHVGRGRRLRVGRQQLGGDEPVLLLERRDARGQPRGLLVVAGRLGFLPLPAHLDQLLRLDGFGRAAGRGQLLVQRQCLLLEALVDLDGLLRRRGGGHRLPTLLAQRSDLLLDLLDGRSGGGRRGGFRRHRGVVGRRRGSARQRQCSAGTTRGRRRGRTRQRQCSAGATGRGRGGCRGYLGAGRGGCRGRLIGGRRNGRRGCHLPTGLDVLRTGHVMTNRPSRPRQRGTTHGVLEVLAPGVGIGEAEPGLQALQQRLGGLDRTFLAHHLAGRRGVLRRLLQDRLRHHGLGRRLGDRHASGAEDPADARHHAQAEHVEQRLGDRSGGRRGQARLVQAFTLADLALQVAGGERRQGRSQGARGGRRGRANTQHRCSGSSAHARGHHSRRRRQRAAGGLLELEPGGFDPVVLGGRVPGGGLDLFLLVVGLGLGLAHQADLACQQPQPTLQTRPCGAGRGLEAGRVLLGLLRLRWCTETECLGVLSERRLVRLGGRLPLPHLEALAVREGDVTRHDLDPDGDARATRAS